MDKNIKNEVEKQEHELKIFSALLHEIRAFKVKKRTQKQTTSLKNNKYYGGSF